MIETDHLPLLQLLHLADSALPVGSLSHSFGLEMLVADGDLQDDVLNCPIALAEYLGDALSEWLMVDAVCCREAHQCGQENNSILELNQQMSSLRLAREPREASIAMGRRFAMLAATLDSHPALLDLTEIQELHHAVAFGYVLAILKIDSDLTVGAFLHQAVLNAISAAQRLLPLGQMQATRIVWDLKSAISDTVQQSHAFTLSTVPSFAHLPETACMRHPCLPTRLFIS